MSTNDVSSNSVENILIILSNLQSGLRSSIVKNRLNEFVSMDTAQKSAIIKDILIHYKKINKTKLVSLFESWMNSLVDMRSQEICIILYSYVLELYNDISILQEFDKEFLLSMMNTFNNLPKDKKLKLLDCLFEVILNTPNPIILMKWIPLNLLRMYKE